MRTWIIGGRVYISGRMWDTNVLLKDGKIEGFLKTRAQSPARPFMTRLGAMLFQALLIFIPTAAAAWMSMRRAGMILRGSDIFLLPRERLRGCVQFDRHQGADIKVYWRGCGPPESHKNCADLCGIHLEGPFWLRCKGAMPEHLLLKPDMDLLMEYQEAAGGNIRYITVSPEVEGIQAIPRLRRWGFLSDRPFRRGL